MTNKQNTVAFLIGAAVGGAAALLLAPESGVETRRRLAQGAKDMKGKTTAKAELIKGALSDAKTAYREKINKQHETLLDKPHESQFDFARGRVRAQPPDTGSKEIG